MAARLTRRAFLGMGATALAGMAIHRVSRHHRIQGKRKMPLATPLLEEKVEPILARGTGLTIETVQPTFYLDLAEHVVRQATRWQTPDGMIGDPYNEPGVESVTATARYTAAIGHLLKAGRCRDLLPHAMRALDWCCHQMSTHYREGKRWPCSVFNVKDMMVLFEALVPLAPAERLTYWREALRAFVPEKLYFGTRNWVFYGTAAETLRIRCGLSDRVDYVDRMLESEMEWWTEHGLYRDPNDPTTYDLTVRQSLALMLEHGYNGRYAQWARDVLRCGALTTLLFVSPTGVVPYGGRSNQYHMMEGMLAYLAEWQAKQEWQAGRKALAGALRRVALAGAEAVGRWLLQEPYFCLKNQMADYPFFGQDGFSREQNAHSGYGLLAANLFAGAYHVADTRIPVGPAPTDVGGYLLYLPDAFYRLWATVGPYHIQIDTRGQPGYDATGLGRLHRRGVPIETALNMSIVANPAYQMPLEAVPRAVALGVGWPLGGDWRYLASAHRETHDVAFDLHREEASAVEFTLSYISRADGLGTERVEECYHLSADGMRVTATVPGAPRLRLQVPLIETDGRLRSEIRLGEGEVEVRYAGHIYRVRVPNSRRRATLEPWSAPNRNGIYRVALLEGDGPQITYLATLD